jgi:hypothetical protein
MGWFGCGALDGDDGMDLRSEVFSRIGVKYSENYDLISTTQEITDLLNENQDKLYDWIKDYDWKQHRNPGWQQEIYIQALLQVLLDYDVSISERGKKGGIPFIVNDQWSKSDKERKEAMDKLLQAVEAS